MAYPGASPRAFEDAAPAPAAQAFEDAAPTPDAQASSELSDELKVRSKRRAELVTGLLARSDVLQRPWCVRACMNVATRRAPMTLLPCGITL